MAENLNAKYNIVDRVKAGITLVTEKAKAIDEQYKVSSSSLAAKALDTANNLKEQALLLNEKYQIVDKVKGQVDRLVVWGKEIDVKYVIVLSLFMFRGLLLYTAVASLECPDLLPPYFIIVLASHASIIVIITYLIFEPTNH